MLHPIELLPSVRDLFDPRSNRAIDVALAEAIRSAGGLDALAVGLREYSFHPEFEGLSTTQIAVLEAMSPAAQATHVSFGSGSVDSHVAVMCAEHGISPDSIPQILDSSDTRAMVAPTFFENQGLGRIMLTGHLTVVQLPGLRLVA
jgi:hypothetical protein